MLRRPDDRTMPCKIVFVDIKHFDQVDLLWQQSVRVRDHRYLATAEACRGADAIVCQTKLVSPRSVGVLIEVVFVAG